MGQNRVEKELSTVLPTKKLLFVNINCICLFVQSFKMVADQMSALEQETPLVKSHVARFGGQALACDVFSLAELAEPFRNGVHYPLFLLCLQSAHRIKDKQWLVDVFNDSKINLQEMLPGECVRTCMHMFLVGEGERSCVCLRQLLCKEIIIIILIMDSFI